MAALPDSAAEPRPAPTPPATALADPGLDALVLLLAFHGRPTTAAHLRRAEGILDRPFEPLELVRAARHQGLTADRITTSWARLAGWSVTTGGPALPALAEMRGGGVTLVAKVAGEEILVHDPLRGRPVLLPRRAFEDAWTGRLLRVRPATTPEAEAAPRFGFAWFRPLLHRHRALLAQSLIASLLLQLFGLVAPLFTMIILDKVLTTGSLATLDVLVLGLLVTSVFEFVMAAARTHLFAYATHRADVELAAALYRHLAALPLSYFDRRKAGALAARVRELEAVRAFLTGAAPTALVDLAFTGLHLAVMAVFAPALTGIVAAVAAAVELI